MSDFRCLDLPSKTDARGTLTVLEDVLPFPMRRLYWITGTTELARGGHRHHRTRQALIALSGRVDVHLDNGRDSGIVELSRPSQCLVVEPEDWHEMHFWPAAVLLVVASEAYDPADYINTPYARERDA